MFCTKCGNQLNDGAKFCTACGQPVNPMSAPEAPVAPPAAEPQLPVQPPVTQNSLDPMVPPVEPEEPAPTIQNSLDPMAPPVEPPVEPESPLIYADTDPDLAPAEEKPKKKKKGLVIGIVCGVVAVVAAVGVLLGISLNNKANTYAQAMDLMTQKNYAEAMALFEELGSYKESAALLEDLQEKQEAYDEAVALLNQRKYEEAIEAFDELGDYADSADQAAYNVNYQKAKYLMECAAANDTSALSLVLEEGTAISGEEGYAATLMYEIAGTIFESLGDYSDSAAMAAECYYGAGQVQLTCGNMEAALTYEEKMDEETAARFHEEYLSYCADSSVLEDMKAMLAECEYLDEAACNELEIACLEPYVDAYFDDEALQELVMKYLEAVYDQRDVLDTMDSDPASDRAYKYAGCLCAEVIDALNADYGFLEDDADLKETYVGQAAYNWAYLALFDMLNESWTEYDTELVDGMYVQPMENTTEYDATLVFVITCTKDGSIVYQSEEQTLDFAAGDSVQVPVGVGEETDFDSWNISYHFENISLDGEAL